MKEEMIKIFENPKFGTVRTLLDEKGDVLFCATDVAKALGYAKPFNAVSTHCNGTLKRGTVTETRGTQELTYIYEPDVYRLITKSKLPAAQEFEAWVFEEVLPSIRKHGAYVTEETLMKVINDPNSFVELLKALAKEKDKNRELEEEIATAEPKVKYYNKLVDSGLLVNFRTSAKEIGVKPNTFTAFLVNKGYLFRNKKGNLLPYQTFVNNGLFEVKEFCSNSFVGSQTLLTAKGRGFFSKLFEELDPEILKEIEMEEM